MNVPNATDLFRVKWSILCYVNLYIKENKEKIGKEGKRKGGREGGRKGERQGGGVGGKET